MNYEQFLTEDRRLVILRGLAAATMYRTNAFVLQRYCDALAHTVSLDRIETDLTWLAEQGLVKLEKSEGVTVATLTPRGGEVAAGRAQTPGVARPQPGA